LKLDAIKIHTQAAREPMRRVLQKGVEAAGIEPASENAPEKLLRA